MLSHPEFSRGFDLPRFGVAVLESGGRLVASRNARLQALFGDALSGENFNRSVDYARSLD